LLLTKQWPTSLRTSEHRKCCTRFGLDIRQCRCVHR
jgi:hypothetical protein